MSVAKGYIHIRRYHFHIRENIRGCAYGTVLYKIGSLLYALLRWHCGDGGGSAACVGCVSRTVQRAWKVFYCRTHALFVFHLIHFVQYSSIALRALNICKQSLIKPTHPLHESR